MKHLSKVLLLAAFVAFITVPQSIFAQSQDNQETEADDEYEGDGDYYEDEEERLTPNGAGDQFISIQ